MLYPLNKRSHRIPKTADGKVISRCFSTDKQEHDRLGEQVTANSNYNRRNDHEASADFADAFQSACIFAP